MVTSVERTEEAEAANRARLAEVLKLFVTSQDSRCRALAAQAFPLTATTRHQFTQSTVSATKLVADTDVAVRVALARNDDVRRLPEDEAGLAMRRALLEGPEVRVRTAARRSGVQVTDSSIIISVLSAAEGHWVDSRSVRLVPHPGGSRPRSV